MNSYVLAPTKIRRSVHERKRKTDEKDAERLLEVLRGHVLAGNKLPAVWIPDKATRDDRELLRTRLEVSSEVTSLKTKVQMLLKRLGFFEEHGLELDKAVRKLSQTDRYRAQVRELLSLKGVGLLTAMVFLSGMGDLRRFNPDVSRSALRAPGTEPGTA